MRRLALLSLALLCACKPPSLKLADEVERVSSWQATIRAIDSAKAGNRIPSRFAADALADARQEIDKSEKKIAELKARGVKPEQ
jgi:hypothetical protein